MRASKPGVFAILRAAFVAGLVCLLAAPAGAQSPPRLLNYQGFLTGSGGTPVNATLQMVFRLYAAEVGGTAVWTENQTVPVSGGVFSVLLGSVTPLPADFATSYWLGVTVGTDAEMTPRLRLVGSPYALSLRPGCVPSAEVCDGLDNDCDGLVDEGFPGLGQVCTVGVGACQAYGVTVCNGTGTGTQCGATAGAPSAEACDGLDNNCDGVVDEGFPGLGQVCTVGVGACQAYGVAVCSGDGSGTQCNATQGSPTAELCDGIDNNCNGVVDEPFTDLGQFCTVGVGACQAMGLKVCSSNGTGTQCGATPGPPATETCNGIDDNCDGVVDEGCPP